MTEQEYAAPGHQVLFNPDAFTNPRTVPAPEPHLPLRKASAQKLRGRNGPNPLLFTNFNGSQGFRPVTSPTAASPYYTPATASTARPERLDFGREDGYKRSFETVISDRQEEEVTETNWPFNANTAQWETESIYSRKQSAPSLKEARSVSEGMRNLRERLARQNRPDGQYSPDPNLGEIPPLAASEDVRTSFRSALTSSSSVMDSAASTERSSMTTGYSSTSDFVKVYPSWPETQDEDLSVEDAIGMYADGFGTPVRGSVDIPVPDQAQSPRPSSSPLVGKNKGHGHQRSLSADMTNMPRPPQEFAQRIGNHLAPPQTTTLTRSSSDIIGNRHPTPSNNNAPFAAPRDRYGFKKVSHHVTLQQFDAWEVGYKEHIERRRIKWDSLMKQYGLSTDQPTRFPPKTDKVKRYVRKGVPPEWRGAAWFWYAGGPKLQKTHEGAYFGHLLNIKKGGVLKDIDREHIERDLNRTYPDNIRFKPDLVPGDPEAGANGSHGDPSDPTSQETPIVRALRRVLQAFAVHNPGIGYCQSLNFIAGLLLLFLDEDEEKTFILLNIVTTEYLPGTHGISLEGANVDIAVLMFSIKDSLPMIWSKLEDPQQAFMVPGGPAPLPTVSLATTAWFMSLFVGTLPIEGVLRVWDCLFFEGSKTLFRVALAIFKAGESQIKAVNDPMEIFQVVQAMPRSMVDVNSLMELCFKKRGGFGNLSQDTVERRREERRKETRAGAGRSQTGDMEVKKSTGVTIKGRFRSKTKGAG